MKHTLEQLKKAEDRLPRDIKEAISSVDLIYAVQNISKEYNLHIDKIGELSDEISLVMLGLTHPTNFVKNIKTRLGVDEEAAREITKEINEKIFNPIKESLLSLHSGKNALISEEIGKNQNTKEQKPTDEYSPGVEQDFVENKNTPNKKNALQKTGYQSIVSSAPIDDKNIEIAKKQGGLVDEKLDGEFSIPKKETEVLESDLEEKPKHIDPYRETIE